MIGAVGVRGGSERREISIVLFPKMHLSATSKQNGTRAVPLGQGQFWSHRKKSQNRDAAFWSRLGFVPGGFVS